MAKLTKSQTKSRVNSVRGALMPLLRTAFNDAKANKVKLHTPWMYGEIARPRDGNEVNTPVDLSGKNGNQSSWAELAVRTGSPQSMPANFVTDFKIDHVEFPNGEVGFILNILIDYDGVKELTKVWEGPEQGNYLAADYHEVIE